jgi:hypothetical protein
MGINVLRDNPVINVGTCRAHAFQCFPGHPPPRGDRVLPKGALVSGERRHQGEPVVRELVGMVPNELHVLAQKLGIGF